MKDNSKLFAKLKELNELKEQNLIPAELYEQKRKEILGEINNSNTTNNTVSTESSEPPIWVGISILAVIVAGIIIYTATSYNSNSSSSSYSSSSSNNSSYPSENSSKKELEGGEENNGANSYNSNNPSVRQNYFDETFSGKWLITDYKLNNSVTEIPLTDNNDLDTVFLEKYSTDTFRITGHFPYFPNGTTQTTLTLIPCESDLCWIYNYIMSMPLFTVATDIDDKLKLTYTGSEVSRGEIKEVVLTLKKVE